jgi:hypothetical protein
MPGHPKFKKLVDEEWLEHATKSEKYNIGGDPFGNWRLVVPKMRPWEGAYARLTEKIARLFAVVNRPDMNPNDLREILKELSVYCKIVRILYDEDVEAKS